MEQVRRGLSDNTCWRLEATPSARYYFLRYVKQDPISLNYHCANLIRRYVPTDSISLPHPFSTIRKLQLKRNATLLSRPVLATER